MTNYTFNPLMMNSLADVKVWPGQRVPDSGVYVTPSGMRATFVRGRIAPATMYHGEWWQQVIDTNPLDRSSLRQR